MSRIMMIIMLGVGMMLGACTQTTGGAPSTTRPALSEARLAVLTARQTPAVDQMVRGLSAGQYFLQLRKAVEARMSGFTGADGTMTLAIRNGDTIHWKGSCTLDALGVCEVPVAMGYVKPNSSLCVKTPWRIAHQRMKPDFNDNENWMCADGLYDYYVLGRRTGRFVVTAIKEAS